MPGGGGSRESLMTPEEIARMRERERLGAEAAVFNAMSPEERAQHQRDQIYSSLENRPNTTSYTASGGSQYGLTFRDPSAARYGGSADASQAYYRDLARRARPQSGEEIREQLAATPGQAEQQRSLALYQQLYGGQNSLGAQQIQASAAQAAAQQRSLAANRSTSLGAAQRQTAAGLGAVDNSMARALAEQRVRDQQAGLAGMGATAGALSDSAFQSAALASQSQQLGDARQQAYLDQLARYSEDEATRQQRLGTQLEEADVNRQVQNQQARLQAMGVNSQLQGLPWQQIIGGGVSAAGGLINYFNRGNR